MCGTKSSSNDLEEDILVTLPSHFRLGTTILDCEKGPAAFTPCFICGLHRSNVRMALSRAYEDSPIGYWTIASHTYELQLDATGFSLASLLPSGQKEAVAFSRQSRTETAIDRNTPYILSLCEERDGIPQETHAVLAIFVSPTARRAWERHRAAVLDLHAGVASFPVSLWPSGNTVRLVSRNIMPQDGVGNFLLGIAGLLARSGIPVSLYAHETHPELAGIVSPIGDLAAEVLPVDTLIYHYSIEDEFLPLVRSLPCRRNILYYHNVTPGKWFRPYSDEFADALDRSRAQLPLLADFDTVLANSRFSLGDLSPYLPPDTPTAVCPPCCAPGRLTTLQEEIVPLPDAEHMILWVGRMAPHKRPERAVDLFGRLATLEDDVMLVMVGGGRCNFPKYADVLAARLVALPSKIQERIVFFEQVNETRLAYLYRRASLFLCTSGHEGYCIPLAEAMSFGLPIAAYPQRAVEETLNGYGTLLPDNQEEAVALLRHMLSRTPSQRGTVPKPMPYPQALLEAIHIA